MLVTIGGQSVNTDIIAEVVRDDTSGAPCIWIRYQRQSIARGLPDTRIGFASASERDHALESLYKQLEPSSAAAEAPSTSDPGELLRQLDPRQQAELFAEFGFISARLESLVHYLSSLPTPRLEAILQQLGRGGGAGGEAGSGAGAGGGSPTSPQVNYTRIDPNWRP